MISNREITGKPVKPAIRCIDFVIFILKGENKLPYTSIQRNFRGFNYQSDYNSIDDFINEMRKEENGNREICWARCFDAKTGVQVAEYHRGILI